MSLNLLVMFVGLFSLTQGAYALNLGTQSIEHVREMKVRDDGNYDVVCMDGEQELLTPVEVKAGRICAHIKRFEGTWVLSSGGLGEGGMRMCDLQVTHVQARTRVLSVEANFVRPCPVLVEKTEDCRGAVCSIRMGEIFYSFDFSTRDRLTVTRLTDGFGGVFTGRNTVVQD